MPFIYGRQARLKEAASLEKHVILKKLRDALEALRGRVASKNKDDVEEAIAMVSLWFLFSFVNLNCCHNFMVLFNVIIPNLLDHRIDIRCKCMRMNYI